MLAIAYIFAVSGLLVLVDRWTPPLVETPNQEPVAALFMLGCYLMGALIGFRLPEHLGQLLGFSWGDGWLERLAEVFGAVGGFLIAARGRVIWISLFILCFVVTLLMSILGYIFG